MIKDSNLIYLFLPPRFPHHEVHNTLEIGALIESLAILIDHSLINFAQATVSRHQNSTPFRNSVSSASVEISFVHASKMIGNSQLPNSMAADFMPARQHFSAREAGDCNDINLSSLQRSPDSAQSSNVNFRI